MKQLPKITPKRRLRMNRRGGFALVVTLTLMILLTVIAVGLLTLSGVTLRSSSQSQARQAAQANARMALMLAIGQLQVHAGPDQRISATADIAGGEDGTPLDNSATAANKTSLDNTDKGLSSVQPGTRYWTGIWKNRDAPARIYTKTPAPELLQWLVSGNEVKPNTVTPGTQAHGLSSNGTVGDLKKSVVLVGSKSAGNDTLQPDYHVSAPLVDIKASGDKAMGRYGWWVGDEGVKAKFNLVASYNQNELATYQNFSTQRSGWEVVDGFNNYPLPGTPESLMLTRVVTIPQAYLLQDVPTKSALPFHSATTESFGLLTDTLQGGMRLDLSSYLSKTLPNTATSAYPNALVSGKNIIPSSVAPKIKGPKWDRLKDFSEFTAKNLTGGNLEVKPATGVLDGAIAPTIVDLRLLLGAKVVPAGSAAAAAATDFKVYPCAKIAVTLANPYSYPLKWAGLDLEIKNAMSGSGVQPSCIWPVNGKPAYVPADPSQPAVFNNTLFRIPAATLPAGGATAYTMSSSVLRPAGSTGKVVVPLVVATDSGADMQNFKNSVILEHTSTNSVAGTSVITLDVREAAVTTQINVELRPAGKSSILRLLERFELDNAEYSPTQRKLGSVAVDGAKVASTFTEPFPLQLYSFQLSQPGVDYGQYLPSPSDLGLRSSTLRTYADFNLQATRFRKPIISYNPPPYFMAIANSAAYLPFTAPGGLTGGEFNKNLAVSPIRWGRSLAGSEKTVLFNPPAPDEAIVSLAQFQHADLTGDDIYASVAHQPGNALGNSYASPFLIRQNSVQSREDYQITGWDVANATSTNYYDISYLLNAAFWDTYYCSTIPATGTPNPRNPKIVKIDPSDESDELRDGGKASSRLLVNGAFNINSTSKDAWKAFLAGSKHLKHPADTSSSTDALFPRSLGQTSPGKSIPSGNDEDSFAGYRRLNDAQIDALAEEITKQVRLRGPFVSLSHFVNRALVGLADNKDLGRSGALQSALDDSGANINQDGSKSAFTDVAIDDDRLNLQADGNGPRADLPGSAASHFSPSGIWPATSRDKNPGAIAGILADSKMLTSPDYRPEQGYRSTGIPGWLTQADLLQVLGPSISARSDTFKIRAYGEALDSAGNVTAKAWCEAIVQRVPEYISPEDKAFERDSDLVALNKTFGRKYNVVSFHWLSPDEI